MYRSRVRSFALFTLAFSLSLFLLTGRAYSEIGEIEHEILEVMADQVRAWNDGDIERYMEGYVRSDSLRFASGGEVTHGWAETLERYERKYHSKRRMGVLTFSELDVTLLSEDAAMVFGKWKIERRDSEPWGLFTLLFKKTDAGWRIVHDHTSSGEY